jgi:hypothetical protein
MSRFESKSREELERYLESVVILGGEGTIQLAAKGPVYVAVVHDGSGFNPGAAIAIDQNQYDLSADVLETAHEIMREDAEKNTEYVAELREEWGDRWEEILTEAFDGKVWTFEDPAEAAAAIQTSKRALEYVEIEEAELEVVVGNVGSVYKGFSSLEADKTYKEYVKQSKSGSGRAAGESVTLLVDGEVQNEFEGLPEGYSVVEAVGGRFMILVNGFQWGPGDTRDRSGAGGATFETWFEAAHKARKLAAEE